MPKKSSSTKKTIRIKLLVISLIIVGAFFRFYQLDGRMQFTWDQIQNAWVMKDIIDDGRLPLLGMVAKGNSGFYIGPAYYYLLVPFYALTNLDPIAAGMFVGVIALTTFIALYLSVCKLFFREVALVSVLFYAVSMHAIGSDRTPWPVSLIPLVSLGVFYFLSRVIAHDERAIYYLATIIGFSFHIHFTAIYFVLITLACLPLFPLTKTMLRSILLSLPLFFVWFIPHAIASLTTRDTSSASLMHYTSTYYHGLHMTRVLQLLKDGFIEYESLLYFHELKFLKFMFLPLFSYFYIRRNGWEKGKYMIYLAWIWFLVPLFVMSVYSGEISNYYFATTRIIAVITMSYVLVTFMKNRIKILQIASILLFIIFIGKNIEQFFKYPSNGGLNNARLQVKEAVSQGVVIPFSEGDPKSYFYYLYGERTKRNKQ